MGYKVTIKYTGPAKPESIRFVSPICPTFVNAGSYADSPAYKDTVYDTNVRGFGKIDLMEPFASTSFPFPVPLTQFKVAVIGVETKGGEGNVSHKVSFTVDTYMEAFWYTEAGRALADQGFEVTVVDIQTLDQSES